MRGNKELRSFLLFRRALVFFAVVSLAACSRNSDVTGVVPPPVAILVRLVLSPDTVNIKVADTTRMALTGIMSDGTVASSSNLRLDSLYLDGTIAQATGSAGNIRVIGIAPGSKTITAGVGGLTVSGMVMVSKPGLRLRVMPSSDCMRKGYTYQYSVAAVDSLNNATDPGPVTWSVQDTTIATVSASGLVSGTTAGHTNVVATASALTALGALIVDPAPLGTAMTCQ